MLTLLTRGGLCARPKWSRRRAWRFVVDRALLDDERAPIASKRTDLLGRVIDGVLRAFGIAGLDLSLRSQEGDPYLSGSGSLDAQQSMG
jgi:hypothetical protein